MKNSFLDRLNNETFEGHAFLFSSVEKINWSLRHIDLL